MGKIRKALETELSKGKLSEETKREIVKASRKQPFKFVPVITILIAVLSLFLVWNIWQTDSLQHSETVSTEQMNVIDLEQSIINYTSELLQAHAQDEFYLNVGESYPLRLALEQNSGLFYSDGDFTNKEKMLLSEFIHYLQEAHVLQLHIEFQPVATIDELLQLAPQFVADWDGMLQSFKPIKDEWKNPKLAAFDVMDWIVLILAISIAIFIIVRLWRNHYRVPPIVWGIILLLSVSSLFLNNGEVGYDETSMVQAIEDNLVDANVRIVGEPKVEAIAGNSLNRYMLLSYEDGLEVLGSFVEEDGFFYWRGSSWGGHSTFIEPSKLDNGQFEDVRLITYIVPQTFDYSTVKMNVEGETIQFEVPKDRASIWMYRHDGKDIDFYYE